MPDTARADVPDRANLVRVGLLGCGTVGSALVELVEGDRAGIARRSGALLEVSRVAVRDLSKPRGSTLVTSKLTDDAQAVVSDPDVDVVVELIGGLEPARSLISEALKSGKPVVTANKELLASYASELFELADANGCELLFEGSVGGAIPLLRAIKVSLAGERIRRIVGIVNGTTNYILSRMGDAGIDYDAALAEAQELGYAERDPSADVEGFDAAAKAAILTGIAFNADVVVDDVYKEGITRIEPADIAFAHRLGYELKLLAISEVLEERTRSEALLDVRVHPAMIPKDHPLASVHGPFNAIFVEGSASGEIMLLGRGAGGMATASAVLGDLIEAAASLSGTRPPQRAPRRRVSVRSIDELRSQYYLAVRVVDRPGVLAAVAQVFGSHSVSIRSMEQVELGPSARIVFVTHLAREADMRETVAELEHLDAIERIGVLLRVFDDKG